MGVFEELTSQKRAAAIAQRAILADRISHSWLFCGPSAQDLLAFARAFAQTLQCTGRSPDMADACMTCRDCRQAMDENHPDIKVWEHTKPKGYSVDEIRNLVSDVYIRPYQSERKIYIVPDAQLINAAGQNALLKTLEEPPEYVVIILLSNSADAMLETILSRCQTIELAPGEIDYDPEILRLAQMILIQVPGWDIVRIKEVIKKLSDNKLQTDTLFELFTSWYRDVLYYKSTLDRNGLFFSDSIDQIRTASAGMTYQDIHTVLGDIRTAQLRLKANVNFDLTMELLLLSMQEQRHEKIFQ